ncbi:transglutaminase family protein [Roseococcus suduntuyensis]|uniref:Transglutaminase-like putative cysteine protease n=1 Tax=Roseococcus suduntuyensis TaxID=455361 RepID=A0A840A9R4_9PROT|nr:transglutaminase family protein [Roseococcus suduntuyensis]MBB3896925.1 transglutaminase-like putative cysteine protease [Roseococcus suduntuyensis]
MIYSLRHRTAYDYAQPVDLAAHLLHLKPRALPGQKVISARLTCLPAPDHHTETHDHFGNPATRLFLAAPHTSFEVEAESLVDVCFPPPPPPEATPPWETVAAAAEGVETADFLPPTRLIPPLSAATDYARPSFPPGRPVLAGLLDLNARIRRDFSFQAGVTSVTTPIAEVMRTRRGVCQDFTQVMLAGMRGLGLPGRYVSGYIRTRPPAGQARRRGADQSHAWVSAWIGAGQGWLGLDPTNGIVVRDEHVVLAWGRDFADVSPLRGVLLGGGEHRLTVSVDLESLEDALPTR